MNRPRDRASAAGLLPRMEARPWADGKTIAYRFHPFEGKPIPLGTDRAAASDFSTKRFMEFWPGSLRPAALPG